VLDVAVGSGAVDVAKYLLEFHDAKPTRETLMMALSSGNFELVRMCWGRLPDEQVKKRLDLLEIASLFHRVEILAWLFRDADPFERELFVGFAIGEHFADVLQAVVIDEFKPWWAQAAAAKWAPAREIEFVPAPEGFCRNGGWFTNSEGERRGIRAMQGKWTRRRTEASAGKDVAVTDVVLPSGVTAISGDAFRGCEMLQSLTIQAGCLSIDDGARWRTGSQRLEGAMAGCSSLEEVKLPRTCTSIGACAFAGCSGLKRLTIPSSATRIWNAAFRGCSSLRLLTLPAGWRASERSPSTAARP
jgi:hypothetical protein